MRRYSVLLLLLLVTGCGKEPEAARRGLLWQDQIDTLDKGAEVEGMLLDSAAEQRRAIDAQAR